MGGQNDEKKGKKGKFKKNGKWRRMTENKTEIKDREESFNRSLHAKVHDGKVSQTYLDYLHLLQKFRLVNDLFIFNRCFDYLIV